MKRVLIITYYWPPSGGSGVQRWLKMSKYLPENGWQPVVYTAKDAEYPVEDSSLERDVCPEAEVIRRPIVEPYTLYKRFLGLKQGEKVQTGFIKEGQKRGGWKERLSLWVRGNLFIPDARRWWVKPSVRYLKGYLREHPVDAIISTGPPHSIHLIAMKLREELGIPWIADFRDPWTEIYYHKELHLTQWADRKHRRLERTVLTRADEVVTVAPFVAQRLEALGGRSVRVVYNGFDHNDATTASPTHSGRFNVSYLGIITKRQNPDNLWQAFKALADSSTSFNNDLEINLIGQIDSSVKQAIEANGLNQHVSYSGYIPHNQVAQTTRSASLLLLLLMPGHDAEVKGMITGKLFEYLASGRPILCIGPEDGDAAQIIRETNAGITIDFEDKEKMINTINNLYQKYLENGLPSNESKAVERYSRRALAAEYAKLLDKFCDRTDPPDVGRIEYETSLLARECGIEMAETRLFEGKYFGTKRFDRKPNGGKLHVISLCALMNLDYHLPCADYGHLFWACSELTHSVKELWKVFRLMAFNLIIGNCDDHVKNFAFIHRDGVWQLSPAYDVLPCEGHGGFHRLSVNGNHKDPWKADAVQLAEKFGLRKDEADEVFEEITKTIKATF